MKPCYALCIALLAVVGCTTETRSYEIAVKNDTSKPITMWTVKENGPLEDAWMSPEDFGMMVSPPPDDKLPRKVIPPGKTISNRAPLPGEFDKSRGRAYVRIYEGVPTLSQMLAIDRSSLDRLDLLLAPGPNSFIITESGGALTFDKGPLPRPSAPPPAP
jgi:hypothetical protein